MVDQALDHTAELVRAIERLAGTRLYGDTWEREIIAQSKAGVESLLQPMGSSSNRSAPAALGGPDPGFDGRSGGAMQIAMLCKALDF